MNWSRTRALGLLLALVALVAAGCGGSSSDSDSGGGGESAGNLTLVAYSTPEEAYKELIPREPLRQRAPHPPGPDRARVGVAQGQHGVGGVAGRRRGPTSRRPGSRRRAAGRGPGRRRGRGPQRRSAAAGRCPAAPAGGGGRGGGAAPAGGDPAAGRGGVQRPRRRPHARRCIRPPTRGTWSWPGCWSSSAPMSTGRIRPSTRPRSAGPSTPTPTRWRTTCARSAQPGPHQPAHPVQLTPARPPRARRRGSGSRRTGRCRSGRPASRPSRTTSGRWWWFSQPRVGDVARAARPARRSARSSAAVGPAPADRNVARPVRPTRSSATMAEMARRSARDRSATSCWDPKWCSASPDPGAPRRRRR